MKSFYYGSIYQFAGILLMTICVAMISAVLIYAQVLSNIGFLIFFLLIVLCVLYLNVDFFTKKVIISKEGVAFHSLTKKFQLKWEEIKFVEFRDIPIFRNRKEFLVFSTEEFRARELRQLISPGEFIALENKGKNILREIKRYWRGPFVGAEHIEYPTD